MSSYHAILVEFFEHGGQRIVEPFEIQKIDFLGMIAYGVHGSHGEYLVKRADTTGQGHENIAAIHHDLLAVGEVLATDCYAHGVAHTACLLHKAGHHADGSAASGMYGLEIGRASCRE